MSVGAVSFATGLLTSQQRTGSGHPRRCRLSVRFARKRTWLGGYEHTPWRATIRNPGATRRLERLTPLTTAKCDGPRPDGHYFVIIRRGGAVGVGAGGEIVNVTQVFQPWGRFSAENSL